MITPQCPTSIKSLFAPLKSVRLSQKVVDITHSVSQQGTPRPQGSLRIIQKVAFKDLYQEVARTNKCASNQTTHVNNTKVTAAPVKENDSIEAHDSPLPQKPDEHTLRDGLDMLSKAHSDEATLMIQDALTAISQTLGMQLPAGIEGMQLDPENADVVKQFSEILTTLKNIMHALAQAAQTNTPVDLKDASLQGTQIIAAQQTVRVATFKIEVALQMVGISKNLTSEEADASVLATNLPFAQNPASKEMSSVDIKVLMKTSTNAEETATKETVKELLAVFRQKAALIKNAASEIVSPTTDSQKLDSAVALLSDTESVKLLKMVHAIKGTQEQNGEAKDSTSLILSAGELDTKTAIKTAQNPGEIKTDPVLVTMVERQVETKMTFAVSKPVMHIPIPNEGVIVTQIVDKMQGALRTGVHEMRLTLKPEAMGEVQIKIQIHGDIVTARMHVENQQVKQIIENNAQILKDALAQHNLQTATLDVSVGQHGANQDAADEWAQMHRDHNNAESLKDGESSLIDSSTLISSVETGRRYGSNSVEFFA